MVSCMSGFEWFRVVMSGYRVVGSSGYEWF